MRYSCETGHDYAERCAVGEEDTGGVGWLGVVEIGRKGEWMIRDHSASDGSEYA